MRGLWQITKYISWFLILWNTLPFSYKHFSAGFKRARAIEFLFFKNDSLEWASSATGIARRSTTGMDEEAHFFT